MQLGLLGCLQPSTQVTLSMSSICPAEPDASRQDRLSLGGGLLVVCVCLLVSFAALASLSHASGGDAPVAIVFPPWIAGSEAVALSFAAGHRVLRSGRLSAIVVVAPAASGDKAPSLPGRAWFAMALTGLAGCLDAAGGAKTSS